ncbi:hypothetical protein NC796_22485 [Aliifodinibius sp. S!AR15-10]|uniref:hypothetical protein n=1 Tax=Aliifodinibius sp. S!AR15-10 TaxID=2950437 RepID=UPI0028569E3E|nr:hypothetical protein [Aliifodinibius sp. S!AR15-10]MDR8393939.1 hypothetical protein [Aliifodinibius sp. S!AR15-10]
MDKQRLLFSVLSLLLLASCSDTIFSGVGGDANLEITTDQIEYTPKDTVKVTFVNDTPEDLFLLSSGCSAFDGPLPNMVIEKQRGHVWENATDYGCTAVYQPPINIEAGTSYSVKFRVGVTNAPQEEGTYRYLFDLRLINENGDPGEKLPARYRYSNEFKVLK